MLIFDLARLFVKTIKVFILGVETFIKLWDRFLNFMESEMKRLKREEISES